MKTLLVATLENERDSIDLTMMLSLMKLQGLKVPAVILHVIPNPPFTKAGLNFGDLDPEEYETLCEDLCMRVGDRRDSAIKEITKEFKAGELILERGV